MRDSAIIKLKVADEGDKHCPSHDALVEVLLSLDKRLARLELGMIVVVTASLAVAGKLTVWPIIQKIAGV